MRKVMTDKTTGRRIIEETGFFISRDTVRFIRTIEGQAYPEEMQLMQESETVGDLSYTYGYGILQLTVVRGEDWYIIYGENRKHIELSDIASSPDRDVKTSRREMHDYLTGVMNVKAHAKKKPIILSAKEDTSYKMIQRMVRDKEYEIIDDIAGTWDYGSAIIMHDLVLRPIMQEDRTKKDNSTGSK
ncbi:MAG: hypothetical protein IKQ35_05090 [Bacilli bacterium]|nr:hypothetical protein [Bacilli bacterium]